MVREVKADWKNYRLTAIHHGDEEYILKAGNRNRTAFKIAYWAAGNFEVFNIWPDKPITSQRDVLRAFQKLLFQGLAGTLDPMTFCQTLRLDPDVKASEITHMVYSDHARKLKNCLAQVALDDTQVSGMCMGIICEMKKAGVDCGMNLGNVT